MKYILICLLLGGCCKTTSGLKINEMPVGAKMRALTDGTLYWEKNSCD